MNFFRSILIFTFALIIAASLASAAAFDVSVVPVQSRISIEDFAKFNVTIKNNLKEQADEYRISNLNFPTWDIRTDPIGNPITINAMPGSRGIVELIVDPLRIKDIGTYIVNINLRSAATGQLQTVPLEVTVLSTEGLIGGYVPTIITSLSIPENIDPRKEVPIKILLSNQNVIDYPELVIKLDSSLIKDTIKTKLGPKEDKEIDIIKSINPLTSPQEDTLVVALFRDDKSLINPIVRPIKISEYSDSGLVSEKKGFLKSTKVYEFVSNNPNSEDKLKVETTLLSSIFSSAYPKTKIAKENNKLYYSWEVRLEDKKMQATVTTNFIPLLIFIAVVIALIAAYFALRAPLTVRKQHSSVTKTNGGVSEMSVVLHVRNRGKVRISDIEVTEIIPSIISIERDVAIGSLQPSKIMQHEKKGTTIVKWNLPILDPSEERVLSYRIKTRLSILGSFSLPAAVAVFKYNSKTYTSTSNRLNFSE